MGFATTDTPTPAQTLRCRAVRHGVTAAQAAYDSDQITLIHRDVPAAGLGLALGNVDLHATVSITRLSAAAPIYLSNAFANHHLLQQYTPAFNKPLPEEVVLHVDGSGGDTLACGWAVTSQTGDLLQCGGQKMDSGETTSHTELAAIASGLLSIPASSDVQGVTVLTDSQTALYLYDNIGEITDDTLFDLARNSKFRAGNWKVTMTGINREDNYLAHSCARAARYESFASHSADWLEIQ